MQASKQFTSIAHPALAALKGRFAQMKLKAMEFRGQVTLLVAAEHLLEVCAFLRDDPAQRYEYLAELHGVDYLNFPGGPGHRFAVNYSLVSIAYNQRLWLKVFLDPTRPCAVGQAPADKGVLEAGDAGLKVASLCGLWPGAEWLEREAYDMFGIIFVGHPDLRRILTWSAFGSYPLRKDYPLRGVGERENYKIVTRQGA